MTLYILRRETIIREATSRGCACQRAAVQAALTAPRVRSSCCRPAPHRTHVSPSHCRAMLVACPTLLVAAQSATTQRVKRSRKGGGANQDKQRALLSIPTFFSFSFFFFFLTYLIKAVDARGIKNKGKPTTHIVKTQANTQSLKNKCNHIVEFKTRALIQFALVSYMS